MYLYRIFSDYSGISITYDLNQNGADFIVMPIDRKKIVIEVGYGEKGFKQIANTMKKIDKCSYGLAISKSELTLNDYKNIVLVPLNYFLLMQ